MTKTKARSEASIQKSLVDYARGAGCVVIKQSTAGRFGTSGWPDLLIITPSGVCGFIEVKREGEEPTPLQTRRMEELRAVKAHVNWTDNVLHGKSLIRALMEMT